MTLPCAGVPLKETSEGAKVDQVEAKPSDGNVGLAPAISLVTRCGLDPNRGAFATASPVIRCEALAESVSMREGVPLTSTVCCTVARAITTSIRRRCCSDNTMSLRVYAANPLSTALRV